jgi:tetratricopeptide (TPR) repeat protein
VSRGQQPPKGKPAGRAGAGADGARQPVARVPGEARTSGRDGRGAGAGGRPGARPAGPAAGRREEIDQRAYDPRREERRAAARVPLPDDVDARMLDPEVRTELRPLARETADTVARHLVMAGRLLEDEPEQALAHARAARALAGRVGPVREAAGLTAYAAGEWAEALSELRAERRITGSSAHLPVMADCERALGRPERALALGDDPAVPSLEQAVRVELVIVLAGARRDLGQLDAAVVQLQEPARRTSRKRPWAARLWYAYADALLATGREAEARDWFAAAAEVDTDATTDAEDRLLELDGVVLEDLQEGEDPPEPEDGSAGTPDLGDLPDVGAIRT